LPLVSTLTVDAMAAAMGGVRMSSGPETDGRRFGGRVVVVTGGGSGIGRACALAFAGEGALVLVVGRRSEPLEATAAGRDTVVAFPADVGDPEHAPGIVAAAVERWGRLDVLVNNAAVLRPTGSLRTPNLADIDEQLATNLVGPTLLASAALPHLEATQGVIVNVSSTYGHRPAPGAPSYYGATKAALESLTRSWALELAPSAVRVNAVAPGPTETGALDRSGLDPAQVKAITDRERAILPTGRRADPSEVARWILHVADPAASWVTGQVIDIDGGMTLVI
jgi:NAD(P)-dependent dehydrogenase (short-subunit alcohol dehydrogenase family)